MLGRAFALTLPLLCSCSSAAPRERPDLPPGWEQAEAMSLTQTGCGESATAPHAESFSVAVIGDARAVHYQDAHFRCEQSVCGYVVFGGDIDRVLVQPCDMAPVRVAACDCLYSIGFVLPGTDREVGLFRRWDNLNGDNEPLPISRAAAE